MRGEQYVEIPMFSFDKDSPMARSAMRATGAGCHNIKKWKCTTKPYSPQSTLDALNHMALVQLISVFEWLSQRFKVYCLRGTQSTAFQLMIKRNTTLILGRQGIVPNFLSEKSWRSTVSMLSVYWCWRRIPMKLLSKAQSGSCWLSIPPTCVIHYGTNTDAMCRNPS